MAARHVHAVADAEQQHALRPVDVFVQLARRMHHERARHDVDRLLRRAHLAAALEAEINLGRVGMTVIGADLAGLPACHRDVALADLAEDLLHVMLGIPLLLLGQVEDMHGVHLRVQTRPAARRRTVTAAHAPASRYASPSTMRRSRSAALPNTLSAAW